VAAVFRSVLRLVQEARLIYPLLLEDDFEKLPGILRAFHSTKGERRATGTVTVRHQNAWLAWLVGFPPEGELPVRLDVAATDDEEVWTRRFGATVLRSIQRARGGLLMEDVGPVRIGFRVRACETGMQFESRGARLWGMPVPLRVEASARGGDQCWRLAVTVAHVGSYCGVMTPAP
jgi:hypothetical protein